MRANYVGAVAPARWRQGRWSNPLCLMGRRQRRWGAGCRAGRPVSTSSRGCSAVLRDAVIVGAGADGPGLRHRTEASRAQAVSDRHRLHGELALFPNFKKPPPPTCCFSLTPYGLRSGPPVPMTAPTRRSRCRGKRSNTRRVARITCSTSFNIAV